MVEVRSGDRKQKSPSCRDDESVIDKCDEKRGEGGAREGEKSADNC